MENKPFHNCCCCCRRCTPIWPRDFFRCPSYFQLFIYRNRRVFKGKNFPRPQRGSKFLPEKARRDAELGSLESRVSISARIGWAWWFKKNTSRSYTRFGTRQSRRSVFLITGNSREKLRMLIYFALQSVSLFMLAVARVPRRYHAASFTR